MLIKYYELILSAFIIMDFRVFNGFITLKKERKSFNSLTINKFFY
jgi:hypothetical protein